MDDADGRSACVSAVVGVLVGSGFELSPRPAAADRKAQLLCCSALDDLLFCESAWPRAIGGSLQTATNV